jgi:hypothetical protein
MDKNELHLKLKSQCRLTLYHILKAFFINGYVKNELNLIFFVIASGIFYFML